MSEQWPLLHISDLCQLTNAQKNLCRRYNISINSGTQIPVGSYFKVDGQRIQFYSDSGHTIYFDLAKSYYKISYQKNRHQLGPLSKAIGKKSQSVIDATCGSGVDSMFFLAMGLDVYAYERHPLVAFLLEDAIEYHRSLRDSFSEALQRFHFSFGDAAQLNELPQADCLYYDPMFPEKKKVHALSRKEMEIFKVMVGADTDTEQTLEFFFKKQFKRVVVKRPPSAPALLKKPTASFSGKSTRYDLYA